MAERTIYVDRSERLGVHRRRANTFCSGNLNSPTKSDHRKVDVLRKRRDFLKKRIAQASKDLSYDKAEMGALDWAIEILESLMD